ncbi:LicD family protein [Bacillus timonensis]|nr:LicD family protein [Bacillus timonensis]
MKYGDLNIDIRDVQQAQVEILLEFDRICKKHKINYQLFAGTLLGAVRHNGFIPWDDDIDVCLLREDFNRLVKVCEFELNTNFFLQTNKTDKNFVLQFAKIRKNDTLFIESSHSDCNIHHGIYIDIFPLDNVMPDTFLGSLQQKTLHLLGKINRYRLKKLCLEPNTPLKKWILLSIHYGLKAVPASWFNHLYSKFTRMFNKKETKYVSHLLNLVSKDRYKKYLVERDTFQHSILWEFESHYFPIPFNYDKVLTQIFGHYMELPPKEKQKPHHQIVEVNFNTKETEEETNVEIIQSRLHYRSF